MPNITEKAHANVRYRFYNRRTGVVAETLIPTYKDGVTDEGFDSNYEALLNCERAVLPDSGNRNELSLFSYDNYVVWAVPGNAVKSYEKRIGGGKNIYVTVRLVS